MTVFILLTLSAPAPFLPKIEPPPLSITPASVMMNWRGRDAETSFRGDGFYSCFWDGKWWYGEWSQKDGVLSVTEWQWDSPDKKDTWKVKLKTTSSGTLHCGGEWTIKPGLFKIR